MSIIGSAVYGSSGYGNLPDNPFRVEPNHLLWFFQIDFNGDGVFDHRVLPLALRSVEFDRGSHRRDDPRAAGPSQPDTERFAVEIFDRGGVYWSGAEARSLANLTSGRLARLLCVSTTYKNAAQPVFTGVLRSAAFDERTGVIIFKGNGLADTLQIGEAEEVRDPSIPYNYPDLGAFIPDSGAPVPINHWSGQSPGTDLAACAKTIFEACGSTLNLHVEPADEIQPEFFTLTGGSAWNALRSVCAAFMARVEFSNDGQARLRRLGEAGADEVVKSIDSLNLEPNKLILPAPGLVNRAVCRVRPLHAPEYTLPIALEQYGTAWSAAGPIAVPPGETLTIDARFSKTQGSVFAANILRVNTDLPFEETILIVNSQPDKSGVNMAAGGGTGEGSFSLTPEQIEDQQIPYPVYRNYGGWQDQARLTLRNTSDTNIAYFFNLRLYAAGLSQTIEPSWVEVVDAESAELFGQRSVKFSSPLIQSEPFARQLATRALRYFKAPTRAAVAIAHKTTHGDEAFELIKDLELGSLVELPQNTGLPSGRHRVIGATTRWLNGAGEYCHCEWRLEKALAPQVGIRSQSHALIQFQDSASWTHAGGTTAGDYFLVCASTRSWGWISAVSVDGIPLTRLAAISLGFPTNGDLPRVEIWGAALPQGAGEVLVTLDKPDWAEFASFSINNLDLSEPIQSVITQKAFEGNPSVTMALEESDLMVCVAGFKQYDPPILSIGDEVYALTSDNNWRGSAASATGLASGSAAWSEVTGGYALAAITLNAKWHHRQSE